MSEAAVISAPESRTAADAMRRVGVLIIDDEAEIRESLQTCWKSRVTKCSRGQRRRGISKLGERPFDLVLLDLALPDRNGLDLLPEIRASIRNCR